ncbi:MAG: hypothetical protein PUI05_03660 [Peptoniphilaceae bacterium]|nr:hypothetical protein [Peptoniphilaceae bacterium]
MKDNIKTYKKLIGDVDEDLIREVEDLQKAKILDVMSPYKVYKEVPDPLNYILIELVIYRFNKIGSEGMASEAKTSGNEVYQVDYEDKLLQKCVDFAKNDSMKPDKWGIKVL